jgi:hypothetical protein
MNLDADGKKRLAAMKAALAAGLPLAGLLAGTAGCSGNGGHVMGRFPDPQAPVEQPAPLQDDADATMGDIPPPEAQPAVSQPAAPQPPRRLRAREQDDWVPPMLGAPIPPSAFPPPERPGKPRAPEKPSPPDGAP